MPKTIQVACTVSLRVPDYDPRMPTIDTALLASDLRDVLGQLIRRLRA